MNCFLHLFLWGGDSNLLEMVQLRRRRMAAARASILRQTSLDKVVLDVARAIGLTCGIALGALAAPPAVACSLIVLPQKHLLPVVDIGGRGLVLGCQAKVLEVMRLLAARTLPLPTQDVRGEIAVLRIVPQIAVQPERAMRWRASYHDCRPVAALLLCACPAQPQSVARATS